MPSYPHRIRLRGPWECTEAGSTPRRVTVPFHCTEPAHAQMCLIRKFGYPGQIDSFERVWLTLADVIGKAAVALNGSLLGSASGPCEFDATALLRPHNRLEVAWPAGAEAGLGETALEVRCAVCLHNLRVSRAAEGLAAIGELVGAWPDPFDLYFFVDGAQVGYLELQAASERTVFQADLKMSAEAAPPSEVRVDLVQGPTLWSTASASVS